jgi:hypothetical protein
MLAGSITVSEAYRGMCVYFSCMGRKAKVVGLLLVLTAGACLLVNFGIWHPWLLGDVAWLWNPLSLFTPGLVGDIPLISGGLAFLLNGVFAVIWSVVLFVIGAFSLLH